MWKPVLLEVLKRETAELHQEAERHVRILEAGATAADYRDYLARMLGFHHPIETAFASHDGLMALGFDAWGRSKRTLLEADLRKLGEDPSRLERCASVPRVSTLARAIGCAYVIEGSMLGGPFILRKLNEASQPIHQGATAFLEGYGRDTGHRWRAFADVVARAALEGLEEAETIAAAQETFRSLTTWFQRNQSRALSASS